MTKGGFSSDNCWKSLRIKENYFGVYLPVARFNILFIGRCLFLVQVPANESGNKRWSTWAFCEFVLVMWLGKKLKLYFLKILNCSWLKTILRCILVFIPCSNFLYCLSDQTDCLKDRFTSFLVVCERPSAPSGWTEATRRLFVRLLFISEFLTAVHLFHGWMVMMKRLF